MEEKLLKFMNQRIGIPSWDYHTFILFRRKDQIVRKYNALGLSVDILKELISKGCQLIIIQMDGEARYKISPSDWLSKGIIDTLSAGQEPHAFMPLRLFQVIGK